jgi:preprotein translocase subunit SecD
MGRRWVGVIGVVLVVAATGCQSDSSDATARSGPRATLRMRPVEAVLSPADTGAGQQVAGPVDAKGFEYVMGDPALTEHDVRRARARNVPGIGWVVDLTLTGHGAQVLDELGSKLSPKSAPQNSIAIVVNGKVESSPAFQEPGFDGREVLITGGYTADQARRLAASLRL